ncbi:hypothetical protein ACNKHO_24340 [Shigella flexneri]
MIQVDDVQTAAVQTLGPVLESHERFPERLNIGFMQVVSVNTFACGCTSARRGRRARGSGALRRRPSVSRRVTGRRGSRALPAGRRLDIAWKELGHPLYMTGPATHVYDGFIHL